MNEEIRVLLVEDDDNDAEMLQRILGKAGAPETVHRLSDGQAALDFLLGHDDASRAAAVTVVAGLQLILLDLKLPRVDGLEVLARLRADPLTARIPIVVLTSSMLPDDVTASYRAGANSFVVKQVHYESHAATLREIGSYWLRLNVTPSR